MSAVVNTSLDYHAGFRQHCASEALPNALPEGQNSPQKTPYGLYAEQLSGSAFTAPSHDNTSAWLYRIRPSVVCGEFHPHPQTTWHTPPFDARHTPPTAMRWHALPYPTEPTDFIDGMFTLAGHGSVEAHQGAATHRYAITANMQDRYFYNADGEMLFVPQEGGLRLRTEFGSLDIQPTEIGVIPRGVKFQVLLLDDKAKGYVCENFGRPFRLPERGLIGANGLANLRDFQTPVAAYENKTGKFSLISKFQGLFWIAAIDHSPLDVVAWHGNLAPYRYDLKRFNTINSVSFDHPDPSIFTVLTSPDTLPGVANVDFVIFPPRWMVGMHTFRPPYFHRNVMSELMGLIHGNYDAKPDGFLPGGASLHNAMTAHGPDAQATENAIHTALEPIYLGNTLAFMFESHAVWRLTEKALNCPTRDSHYLNCWATLKPHFKE